MTKLFIFLLTLTLAAIAAMWFIENDGSITIQWLGYHIQTSVAFSIVASIILFVICTTILQMIIWVKRAPKKYKKSLTERKRDQGLTSLTEGFAAIAAGDTRQAKKLTKQAVTCLGSIPLTKLLAAQTAQLEGDRELAKVHYTAMLENKETEVIAIKGLLVQAKQDGDLNKAIFLAEKAISLQPDADWAISILLDLYKITKQWSEVEKIIQKALKVKVIDPNSAKRMQAIISLGNSLNQLEQSDASNALVSATKAYKLLPNFPPIAANYAKLLIKSDNKRKALKVLQGCFKVSPHPQIAQLYMQLYDGETIDKKQKHAEKLLSLSPNSVQSHVTIAKEAMLAENFSKARNHLKIALSINETSSICKLMAELEEQAGAGPDIVTQWQQRAETSNPDLAWSCTKCGSSTPDWNINCSNCNSFDSLKWSNENNPQMNIIPPARELLVA